MLLLTVVLKQSFTDGPYCLLLPSHLRIHILLLFASFPLFKVELHKVTVPPPFLVHMFDKVTILFE